MRKAPHLRAAVAQLRTASAAVWPRPRLVGRQLRIGVHSFCFPSAQVSEAACFGPATAPQPCRTASTLPVWRNAACVTRLAEVQARSISRGAP